MEIRYAVGRKEYERMTTQELREAFLVDDVFTPGEIQLAYWETDRAVVGSVVPTSSPLKLEGADELASDFFCQRREIGLLNIGAPGQVTVDGTAYDLAPLDCLYVGRGSREVTFTSADPAHPAKFYLISYPAHAVYPTTLATQKDANQRHLGSPETSNQRTLSQYVHENGVQSGQLVMGFTQLAPGSVWNTMPPHTHARRSEIYLYFNIPAEAAVVHLMGPSDETRHLLIHNEEIVLSPIWSIHAGCGTQAYSFVWAMGGENQRFDDMDAVAVGDLR